MRTLCVAMSAPAVLMLVMAGCGGSQKPDGPPLVPVKGVITLDGKPLAAATVTFIPVSGTRGGMCYGATDANGAYQLMTDRNEPGAPAGEFKVICNKWVLPDGSDFPANSKVSPIESNGREKLPPCYSQEASTELKARVSAEGNSIDFQLTSKH